jgi:IclR family pca regulon transcriptional regulator
MSANPHFGMRTRSDVVAVKASSAEVDERYRVDAVGRAMLLLLELTSIERPARLRELTERLGWNKTTIFRLVRTLEEFGAVREIEGQGFVLGPALIGVGQAAIRALQLPAVARPHLQRLHDLVGETVNLAVLSGSEIVIAERVEGRDILGLRIGLGSTLPSYCTSVGLVLLAGLDDAEVQHRLAGVDLEARGPKTLSSMSDLLKRLEKVRGQGYALNDEELAVGHRAAAAPVLGHDGRVIAAINVSVPSARKSRKELIDDLVPKLRDAAADISHDLGASVEIAHGGRTA